MHFYLLLNSVRLRSASESIQPVDKSNLGRPKFEFNSAHVSEVQRLNRALYTRADKEISHMHRNTHVKSSDDFLSRNESAIQGIFGLFCLT